MRISDWSSGVCSADLGVVIADALDAVGEAARRGQCLVEQGKPARRGERIVGGVQPDCRTDRSEEHTSELQSLMRYSYAAFYLTKQTHLISRTSSSPKDPKQHIAWRILQLQSTNRATM